jgi:hypothetical protein
MATSFDLSGILKAALDLQFFCEIRKWDFCFIGGLAVQPWGDPRATQDADLSLLTGFGNEEEYVDQLLAEYKPRRENGREFALNHRVLLLWSHEGIALDIALGALPFEEISIKRSVKCAIAPGHELKICTPEDLIVHKAFASRDRDWADIDMVLLRQGRQMKIEQIFHDLTPLVELKEDSSIIPRLEALMRKRSIL